MCASTPAGDASLDCSAHKRPLYKRLYKAERSLPAAGAKKGRTN